MHATTTTADVIDEIIALFEQRGGGDYGESITQTAHALQSAWWRRSMVRGRR